MADDPSPNQFVSQGNFICWKAKNNVGDNRTIRMNNLVITGKNV